ncbi:uncharacterized protein [Panulirus ornatus]|uniref:uncharacterized protein isoform X2 n=1 Tax=Panulirus ornatus TaxID=150431 RepID=UPI003A8C1F15
MEVDCVTLNIAGQDGATIEVEVDSGEDGSAKAQGRWCLRRLRSCLEGISDIVPEEHDPYNTSLFNKTAMFHTDTTEKDILNHDWCIQLFGKIYIVTKAFVYNLLSIFLAPFLACFWGIIFACIAFWIHPRLDYTFYWAKGNLEHTVCCR